MDRVKSAYRGAVDAAFPELLAVCMFPTTSDAIAATKLIVYGCLVRKPRGSGRLPDVPASTFRRASVSQLPLTDGMWRQSGFQNFEQRLCSLLVGIAYSFASHTISVTPSV